MRSRPSTRNSSTRPNSAKSGALIFGRPYAHFRAVTVRVIPRTIQAGSF